MDANLVDDRMDLDDILYLLDQVDKWEFDCKKELEEKGYSYDDIKNIDFYENGSVYFKSGFMTDANFVTPWEQSKYFVE